jgi:sarcosine oxidase gamma subunit
MNAWLRPATAERRIGVKGKHAARLLTELGLLVPRRANAWSPLRAADRDDSPNVIARLGHTEFFIEEQGDAPGIAALEARLAEPIDGAYPVLREDVAVEIGGGGAAAVLAQVCNVDLAALDTATKPVVMTLMIGIGVLVLPQPRDDGTVYRIWCDPTLGAYLESELEEIIKESSAGSKQ